MASSSKFSLGICQMLVGSSKEANVSKAVSMIRAAKQKGAQLVVLPECFNSPYGTKYFNEYAEPIPAVSSSSTSAQSNGKNIEGVPQLSPFYTHDQLSAAAKENGVYLIAGSIPERGAAGTADEGKLFNTTMAFAPCGTLVATYRKMHLFRLRSEQLTMDEGETLTAGDAPAIVSVKAGDAANMPMDFNIGLAICFDVRYPQLAIHYAQKFKTSMLVYPSAFNMVTGPKYWRLSSQSRAVDSQQYLIMASPARDTTAGYVAWGHSHVINPAGDIVSTLDEHEGILVEEVDLEAVGRARQMLPILAGTRDDVYSLSFKE